MTAIEWTDETWNPTTGCSKVSPGCDHCYAETLSLRFGWSKKPWTPGNAAENVVLHPERLHKPATWRTPRRVFVNSMSDLFHEQIPDDYVREVFAVMAAAPQHTFQVLTKRPVRARALLSDNLVATDLLIPPRWPLPNVWIGVSIESWRFNHRADVLRQIPAAVRFVSAEPLLSSLFVDDRNGEPLGRRALDLTGIDWLIVGGESGTGYRPMEPLWVRELLHEATVFNTAFFFKQWGGKSPKAGGRVLDGRTWDEYPAAKAHT